MAVYLIGITATQTGCTEEQVARARTGLYVRLHYITSHYHRVVVALAHGDCIGGDAQMHAVAREFGIAVQLHPPINPAKRAWCQMLPGEIVMPPDEYIARNHAIVDSVRFLIALPKEEHGEELRSGTWATVRYARKIGRPGIIVRPSGRTEPF